MKNIFDTAKLGSLPAKNRIVMSATGHLLMSEDGIFSEEYFKIYEALAKGGVGTIIVELADMLQNINNPHLIPQHKRITDLIHTENANAILQIGLVDYHENSHPYPIAPSDLTSTQIDKIVCLFVDTSIRAKESGFDGVQIHAGHGLFLNQFISPEFNHRTDAYGGSQENKTRILIEMIQAIKKAAPDLHLSIKLNFHDFSPAGLQPQDSIEIAKLLAAAGLDSIEVTANNTSQPGIKAGINEGYFYKYGKALAEQIEIPVIVVGGYRSVEHMNKLLNDSKIEFFSLSRPFIREPDLVNRWQSGDLSPAKCVSCNACYRTGNSRCIFRLKEQRQYQFL